mmetsp:Transcript_27942/g.43404  ORF Transcript_27942/g.43404 Transcript_27942/m.43404 type:complete len:535 (-) Transcript_27942:345-1949(-)|eukprot:CAMPEP_0196804398 /NCGR_PEP_ID=MMETSP1362-20130617/3986_1 /TAXON_ID=163516 /ORGANISM="Leptocylindrus danicus, Strain CCMP1856" /LENGTH=534 /DNA_ID=CAMNT_0042176661 /DNA_START=167 /DNA_END=1771 /DNA_ORIENTATION=-
MPAEKDSNHLQMQKERKFLGQLFEAARSANFSELSNLASDYAIASGVPVEQVITSSKDGNKRTVLHFACLSKGKDDKDEDDIVELILHTYLHKFNNAERSEILDFVRQKDKSGNTPLMLVCQLGNTNLAVKRAGILMKHGGTKQVLARAKSGATALHFAATQGHVELLPKLVEHGKAALHAMSTSGTPLHWAAGAGSDNSSAESRMRLVATIEELIRLGAKPDLVSEQGITPLILAIASNNDANATILVRNGADRGIILKGNVTVFHMAADLNLKGTLSALLDDQNDKATADVIEKCLALQNFEGRTPLQMAVKEKHVEAVRLLMPGGEHENDLDSAKLFIDKHKDEIGEAFEANDEPIVNGRTDWKDLEERVKKSAEALIQQESENSVITPKRKEQGAAMKAEGNDHFGKKKWSDAITAYSKAIEFNPCDATYYSNRSACYMELKHYEKALEDGYFSRFLKMDWAKACFRISKAKLALEDYEDAAVWAWNGVTLDNTNDELKRLMQKCINLGKKKHKETKAKEKAESKKKLTV